MCSFNKKKWNDSALLDHLIATSWVQNLESWVQPIKPLGTIELYLTPLSCYMLLLDQPHICDIPYQCLFQTVSTFSCWSVLCEAFGPADWLLGASLCSKHPSISRCWKSRWLLFSTADTIVAVHCCVFISFESTSPVTFEWSIWVIKPIHM